MHPVDRAHGDSHGRRVPAAWPVARMKTRGRTLNGIEKQTLRCHPVMTILFLLVCRCIVQADFS